MKTIRALRDSGVPEQLPIGGPKELIRPGIALGENRIRQDHDGGFQAFGAMHRHHPHHVTGFAELAFHLQGICGGPGHKTREAGNFRCFIGQGLAQQGINAVFRLRPQSFREALPGAVAGQNALQ